jgi:hypothetical protein
MQLSVKFIYKYRLRVLLAAESMAGAFQLSRRIRSR